MTPFGSRNGQAIILVVVAASLILIGALAFAIHFGQAYALRDTADFSLYASAEAGIMSILRGTNATSAPTFGTGPTPIAPYTCSTSDGRTPCVYARNNGFGGTASDTVTLSYPQASPASRLHPLPFLLSKVTVQRTLNTGFVQFLKGPGTHFHLGQGHRRHCGNGFARQYHCAGFGPRGLHRYQWSIRKRQRRRNWREFH